MSRCSLARVPRGPSGVTLERTGERDVCRCANIPKKPGRHCINKGGAVHYAEASKPLDVSRKRKAPMTDVSLVSLADVSYVVKGVIERHGMQKSLENKLLTFAEFVDGHALAQSMCAFLTVCEGSAVRAAFEAADLDGILLPVKSPTPLPMSVRRSAAVGSVHTAVLAVSIADGGYRSVTA